MRLYIMRHGHAADSSETGRDADRPLTNDGRRYVEQVGALLLAHHRESLPRILSSTYLRAAQTAEIMAHAIAGPAVNLDHHEELEPDEPLPMKILRGLSEDRTDALIVGHHPMVITMLRILVRDSAKLPLGLHPGMLVGIERAKREGSRFPVEGSFQITTILKP
jgi:phosphohistidine phosphatase